MQKRALIILVVIVAIAGGAYAAFHKSSTKPASSTGSTSSSQNTATNGSIVQTKTDPTVGQYLADSSGNALYTYSLDTNGISNCSGSCISNWPIYAVSSSSVLPTNVTVITRSDGNRQYAYKGMPLYTFTSDSSGQVTGDGVENFHVAKP